MDDERTHGLVSSRASSRISTGEIIGGKYRVGEVLGVGGMGVVFEADQFHLGRSVAIKVLSPEQSARPELVGRFLREARAVAQLDSDHVVRVLDTGILPEGTPYLVMERLRGCDLAQLLESRGPLPCHEAARYVIEACHGLDAAHRIGLVHRDLKPQNLFAAERSDGSIVIKVLDFGISKVIDGMSALSLEGISTCGGAILGSPPYMSPEQLLSAKEVDTRSDIWALGIVLFELLTGARPFGGSTLAALATAVDRESAPLLRSVRADVPAALERVVARCLQKSKDARYRDVSELAADLERASPTLTELATTNDRPRSRPPVRAWRSALQWGAVAVAVVGVALTARAKWGSRESDDRAKETQRASGSSVAVASSPMAPVASITSAGAAPPVASVQVVAGVDRPDASMASTRSAGSRVVAPSLRRAGSPSASPAAGSSHPLFFPE